ncbi:cytochrome P450 family protein [Blastomonas sp. RAC04]|uniref:cytochrome P450 n=1 Tax=Blastomonas sp. RAC04 TaxID=1842535 RepID=UPI00083CFBED|nr:cytochrome P450 [Blastomonas sp. RAC04]AOF99814.1 cytochrome P450 family protein [Blastomonas sp. RAC04]
MRIDPANPVAPTNIVRRFGMDQVPDHVPPELVRQAGLIYSPEFLADPYTFFPAMHERFPPIFYDVGPFGNAWVLTKHEDALFALRHAEYFSNEDATPFPRDPNNYFYFIPIEIDPPEHRKYRNIVDPVVSPQGVLKLEERIRALANELIDEVIEKGECEFDEVFGRPLPVLVFLDLMGLPRDMCDTFVSWAMALLHSNDRKIMGDTLKTIGDYLTTAIAEKEANPDDGLVSRIVHAEFDGKRISDKEAFGFVTFLFIAGLDTVFATLNNIWLWLARNPERRQEIIDNPDNINAQVEELLRVFSVTFSGRTVAQDVEVRGVQMKKGDKVTSILPACNYDPDVFPNPTVVDFNRPKKIILAFTVGIHSCMGAHLARLEIKIALQEWLKRIPDFKVRPGAETVYRPGGVIGPESVPLVW